MYYSWTIPGNPKPYQVWVRMSRPTTAYHAFKDWQEQIQAFYKVNWNKSPLDGPIGLDLSFFLPIPETAPIKEPARSAWIGRHMIMPPDVSNLVKAWEDGAKKFLFLDDAQVTMLVASKSFCDGPIGYTMVSVREVLPKDAEEVM